MSCAPPTYGPGGVNAYPARCHVCGVEHTVHTDFLSSDMYADGRARISCGRHSGAELRAVWSGEAPDAGALSVRPRGSAYFPDGEEDRIDAEEERRLPTAYGDEDDR